MKIPKLRLIKLAILALVVMPSLLLYRCVVDTFDMKLKIVNQTSGTIFVDLSNDKSFNAHPVSIDTVKGDTLWNYMIWVPSLDSLENIPPSLGSWESFINKRCQDSTLTVFLFDKELLKSVKPDSLISNQLYSKKYSYKVKDLEKLNWRVEYK